MSVHPERKLINHWTFSCIQDPTESCYDPNVGGFHTRETYHDFFLHSEAGFKRTSTDDVGEGFRVDYAHIFVNCWAC